MVNDKNQPKTRQAKMPRVYIHFFLGVSLLIAIIFVTVQLVYVASGRITGNLLLFNLALFTVIFLLVMGTSYLLVRRAVLRQMEYKLNLEEANAFTESVLNSLPDTYHSFDLEGKPLKWNKATGEVTGYSDEEISSMSPSDFVSEEDRRELESTVAEALGGGRRPSYEATVITKDGKRISFEFAGPLLAGPDGNVIGFGAIGRDITERKLAEEAVRESEEKYRSLFESSLDGIVVVGLEGKIVDANRAYLDMLGYTLDEIREISYKQLTPKKWHTEEMEIIRDQVLKHGYSEGYEKESIRKDGTIIPISIKRWLITNDDGNTIAMCAITHDITERKRAEEELKRVNAELKGYAHTVSHDLKGPLTSISLAVDMLGESVGGIKSGSLEEIETVDEIVAILGRNVKKANRRIKDLLSLAESGQVPGDVFPVDVAELLEEILDECSQAIRENGVEVKVSPDLGAVTANRTQMFQLFSNLIRNAIEHNSSESPVVAVSYLGYEGKGGHRYLVRDNGDGIPEDIINRVFVPFVKGEGGGTGIGLSITEKIAWVYGGEIRAYNDNGACLEFTLRDF